MRPSSRLARPGQGVTFAELLALSLAPVVRWIGRKRLQAELRSLYGLAGYFEWQQSNGQAGLADTHKRIAVAQSDLNALSGGRHG